MTKKVAAAGKGSPGKKNTGTALGSKEQASSKTASKKAGGKHSAARLPVAPQDLAVLATGVPSS